MPPHPLPARNVASARWNLLCAVVVGLAAFAWMAHDRGSEPAFLDESSNIAQARDFDLVVNGQFDDAWWLAVPALDQPPLNQFLVGLAMRLGGSPRPGPKAALAWHRKYNLRRVEPEDAIGFGYASPSVLSASRWPAHVFGAVGCVAVFALGVQVRDWRVGMIAGLLLAFNPLYRQQSRVAVNDVPCEALALASVAVALWAWKQNGLGRWRPTLWAWPIAGVLGGLAVLAKLTGLIVLIHVAAWTLLAMASSGRSRRVGAVLGAAGFAVVVAFVVGMGNPTLTAQPTGPLDPETQALASEGPLGRAMAMVRHRMRMSALQQGFYPEYALKTLPQKAGIALVQGFGRFSPFGPAHSHLPKLYDWPQDRWGLVWLPWVACGAVAAAARGRNQRQEDRPPTAWAVLATSAITVVCVVGYIPMAWDRYLLPLLPWSALLAALFAVALYDRLARMFRQPH